MPFKRFRVSRPEFVPRFEVCAAVAALMSEGDVSSSLELEALQADGWNVWDVASLDPSISLPDCYDLTIADSRSGGGDGGSVLSFGPSEREQLRDYDGAPRTDSARGSSPGLDVEQLPSSDSPKDEIASNRAESVKENSGASGIQGTVDDPISATEAEHAKSSASASGLSSTMSVSRGVDTANAESRQEKRGKGGNQPVLGQDPILLGFSRENKDQALRSPLALSSLGLKASLRK